jgi:hypothetical protein
MKNKENKLEILKDYLLETYPDGYFYAKSDSFKDVLGIAGNNVAYIEGLIKENFITRVEKATKTSKKWTPAKYKINAVAVADDKDNTRLEETFKGHKITFIPYKDTFIVSQKDIEAVLKMSKQAINIITQRNKELFEGKVINDRTIGRSTYFTRKGLITLLMKLCTSRLDPEKQRDVIDFQLWAMDTIDTVISKGFIKLTAEEHEAVKGNLTGILNADRKEVDRMFDKIMDTLGDVIYMFNQALVQKDIVNQRCDELERENQLLIAENEGLQVSKDSYKQAYEQTKTQLIHYRALSGRVINE